MRIQWSGKKFDLLKLNLMENEGMGNGDQVYCLLSSVFLEKILKVTLITFASVALRVPTMKLFGKAIKHFKNTRSEMVDLKEMRARDVAETP